MTFFDQVSKNPSLLVRFITIYNDDEITKALNTEVLELIYYGKLTYEDIMLKMSYFDRRFWIANIKKIKLAEARTLNPDVGSFDDDETLKKLGSFSRGIQ